MMIPKADPIIASLLRKGEEVCFRVTSASMKPMISPGDKIGVRQKVGSYGFSDIVLFRDAQGFCVHRIIGATHGRFFTKGDSKSAPDPPIRKGSILGQVIWVEKAGKSISLVGPAVRFMNRALGAFSLMEAAMRRLWTGLK